MQGAGSVDEVGDEPVGVASERFSQGARKDILTNFDVIGAEDAVIDSFFRCVVGFRDGSFDDVQPVFGGEDVASGLVADEVDANGCIFDADTDVSADGTHAEAFGAEHAVEDTDGEVCVFEGSNDLIRDFVGGFFIFQVLDRDGDMVIVFGFIVGGVNDDDFGEIGLLNTSACALIDGETADAQIGYKFCVSVSVAFVLRDIKETLHIDHHSIEKSLKERREGKSGDGIIRHDTQRLSLQGRDRGGRRVLQPRSGKIAAQGETSPSLQKKALMI